MSSRFVSQFRHVLVRQGKPSRHITRVAFKSNPFDSNYLAMSTHFIAVPLERNGIGVYPVQAHGNIGSGPKIERAHSGGVVDLDFSPFDSAMLASSSIDGKVKLWKIPEDGLSANMSEPMTTLAGHQKKVGLVRFHPTAANVLVSNSFDKTVKFWDLNAHVARISVPIPNVPLFLSFDTTGATVACTARDKRLRVLDPRSPDPVVLSHLNPNAQTRGLRATHLTGEEDSKLLMLTGFGKGGDRFMSLLDLRVLGSGEPAASEEEAEVPGVVQRISLDTATGILMLFWDEDLKILYSAGKGEGKISYYDLSRGLAHPISFSKTPQLQRGIGLLPKAALDTSVHEIGRFFKITRNTIIPLRVTFPKLTSLFQPELFPETRGYAPSSGSSEFFDGAELVPLEKISLAPGMRPDVRHWLAGATIQEPAPSVPVKRPLPPPPAAVAVVAAPVSQGLSDEERAGFQAEIDRLKGEVDEKSRQAESIMSQYEGEVDSLREQLELESAIENENKELTSQVKNLHSEIERMKLEHEEEREAWGKDREKLTLTYQKAMETWETDREELILAHEKALEDLNAENEVALARAVAAEESAIAATADAAAAVAEAQAEAALVKGAEPDEELDIGLMNELVESDGEETKGELDLALMHELGAISDEEGGEDEVMEVKHDGVIGMEEGFGEEAIDALVEDDDVVLPPKVVEDGDIGMEEGFGEEDVDALVKDDDDVVLPPEVVEDVEPTPIEPTPVDTGDSDEIDLDDLDLDDIDGLDDEISDDEDIDAEAILARAREARELFYEQEITEALLEEKVFDNFKIKIVKFTDCHFDEELDLFDFGDSRIEEVIFDPPTFERCYNEGSWRLSFEALARGGMISIQGGCLRSFDFLRDLDYPEDRGIRFEIEVDTFEGKFSPYVFFSVSRHIQLIAVDEIDVSEVRNPEETFHDVTDGDDEDPYVHKLILNDKEY